MGAAMRSHPSFGMTTTEDIALIIYRFHRDLDQNEALPQVALG